MAKKTINKTINVQKEDVKYKKFQIIEWKFSKTGNEVNISSKIYETYNEFSKEIVGKKYVVAIGLNPSNKTSFNDDSTNLYLRDKIHCVYGDADGYILINLIPKNESDSSKVSSKDIDTDYTEDCINLLKNYKPLGIVLFFGKSGISILNENKEVLKQMKKLLEENSKIIKYTSRPEEFVHPGRSANSYILVDWKDGLLEDRGD